MEDPRELWLGTLIVGDKVRIVPVEGYGNPWVDEVSELNDFDIVIGRRRFGRRTGLSRTGWIEPPDEHSAAGSHSVPAR